MLALLDEMKTGFGHIESGGRFQESQTQDPSLLFRRWGKRGLIYGDSG
jgi:hypothetical protein